MSYDEMLVFAGSGSRKLTARICDYLRIPQGKNETLHFSDGNTFVRILENVRGRRVYLVQSTVFPANDNFMELLFWIDAFKRAGAESVTVLIPYFSYAKGDKKDEPRVSIRARACADAIEAAGADRVGRAAPRRFFEREGRGVDQQARHPAREDVAVARLFALAEGAVRPST